MSQRWRVVGNTAPDLIGPHLRHPESEINALLQDQQADYRFMQAYKFRFSQNCLATEKMAAKQRLQNQSGKWRQKLDILKQHIL